MEFLCELRGIRKQYDLHQVLDDFALSVKPGEFIALTGASGAGKSTVLNLLGLLESPDGGEVRLFGERAPRPRSRAANLARRDRLGYLFQNFALIDSETVEHNLAVALTYAKRGTPKQDRVKEALAQVGLRRSQHRKIHSLSGGEQQRVAVARLLLKPCDLVLADEPTGSLDAKNRDRVLDLLQKLNEAGKTIIVATHDEAVADRCSRIVELSGRAAESPQERVASGH
ncbi:ABC transporter ATP-binding protein [Amycolatopsis rubida]|uniref:ABC transporter ATP-binding protein n=1 Tax=Amycolatopsis rubida TaxID=112413 RepID=A0A1I5HTQ4_9PSEU|nr:MULTISPECIES: ABC transporter ATP-binding protein [Amycolatopsis]MYW90915.1 putative bacteriocin export ABC transporter [Amycolatopsis rubida]NEC55900.1 ABC transporter ATP-binding protein [Amycolatopsis rubida]OAP26017.1 Lipoprotein-releasing system ATP-binding protein LolD [Amycolatopsis sp. M39]SFO51682.1 putative ABC transport system ATP-binding protein [Amycolatopsis rubida]